VEAPGQPPSLPPRPLNPALYRTARYDFNKRRCVARSLFITSKFYVFVLCVRVCNV